MWQSFVFSSGHNALDIAHAGGDSTIIDLVTEKMNSLPKVEGKGKKKARTDKQQVTLAKITIDQKLIFLTLFIINVTC